MIQAITGMVTRGRADTTSSDKSHYRRRCGLTASSISLEARMDSGRAEVREADEKGDSFEGPHVMDDPSFRYGLGVAETT